MLSIMTQSYDTKLLIGNCVQLLSYCVCPILHDSPDPSRHACCMFLALHVSPAAFTPAIADIVVFVDEHVIVVFPWSSFTLHDPSPQGSVPVLH